MFNTLKLTVVMASLVVASFGFAGQGTKTGPKSDKKNCCTTCCKMEKGKNSKMCKKCAACKMCKAGKCTMGDKCCEKGGCCVTKKK